MISDKNGFIILTEKKYMRRHLLYPATSIITFIAAVSITPYSETGGLRGLFLSVTSVFETALNSRGGISREYRGVWKDYDGHALSLAEYSVTDGDDSLTIKDRFHVIKRFNFPETNEKAYLVQVIHPEKGGLNYLYFGFNSDGSMSYFTYDSMEDYGLGKAATSDGFFRSRDSRSN